jgi:hypothetical protein
MNIIELYRGINEFKRVYEPRNNLVKDENGDLLADSHSVFNRWKNYFSVIECEKSSSVIVICTYIHIYSYKKGS